MALWVLCALGLSIFGGLLIQLNHVARLPGDKLAFVRAVWVVGLLIPVIPFMHLEAGPVFYLVAALVGVLWGVGDGIMFRAAREYGGRLTSMVLPMKIFGTFLLWFMIDQAYRASLTEHTRHMLLVLACLLAATVAVALMRKTDASRAALVTLVPAAVAYMLADTSSKVVLDNLPIIPATLTFTLVAHAAQAVVIGLWLNQKGRLHALGRGTWAAGALAGLTGIGLMICMLAGFASAPNPAYVTAVSLLTIVWLWLYNQACGHHDDANPWAMALLLLGTVGLVFVV